MEKLCKRYNNENIDAEIFSYFFGLIECDVFCFIFDLEKATTKF